MVEKFLLLSRIKNCIIIYSKRMIYIPIGEDCYSTLYLIEKKLRLFATIFDWIIISPSSILKLFEDNFKDYCHNVVFDKISSRTLKHTNIEIYDKTYDILLPHAVNDMDKSLKSYRKDVVRRIKRLEYCFKNKIPLCFVYKSVKYHPEQNLLYNDKLIFGKEEFIKMYPKLVKILKNRYGYRDESIRCIIL